jgi:hypothetical protein
MLFRNMSCQIPERQYSASAADAPAYEGKAYPSQEERLAIDKIFDPAYYLQHNPDVKAAKMDPALHFFRHGWREGRNPSPLFDVQFYLNSYPDVAAAGINPAIHYVWSGSSEGRLPQRPLDLLRRRLETAVSPRQNIASWADAACKSSALPVGELERILLSTEPGAGLIISFSHDDYLNHYGGVQNVIGEEQQALNKQGWRYLHVAPADPLPILSDETSSSIFKVSLRINGEQLGSAVFEELISATSALRKRNGTVECVVHHLLGFSPELIGDFLSKTGLEHPIFWIHDFFSICPNYMLLRNNVDFCGGPDPDSGACRLCCYGTERKTHLQRIRILFQKSNPIILAPSRTSLELWKSSGRFQHRMADVVPLARLVRAEHGKFCNRNYPLRVAFTGARCFHKGWEIFEELAYRHANDDRYLFFQLGLPNISDTLPTRICNKPVTVGRKNRNAMVEEVAKTRIDLIVNWSLWPETFCFTALEALAGGAFVVARADSGNVWPVIEANAPDQGCVVKDKTRLFDLFQSGEIPNIIRNANCRYGILMLGKGSADWLSQIHSQKTFFVSDAACGNLPSAEKMAQ